MPSLDEIRTVLATVQEPELHRDIVALGMVKGVKMDGSSVRLIVELTTPACPMKEELEKRIQTAVLTVKGVSKVDVEFTARVQPTRPVSGKAPIPGVKNIVPVYACKGGVGKSTLSTNLATALSLRGASVGLLDADVHGPNIPLMMGVSERPAVSEDNKITPLTAHGVKVMSLGLLQDANLPSIWRGPMIHGAILQLLRDTVWGELDYLIIDLPPGTGDAQLTIIQSVPLAGVVFVTTPQGVSLVDGVKGINMFRKLNIPLLGMVENMSGFFCPHCGKETDIFSKGGGQSEAEKWKMPFLGAVPIDPSIVVGGDSGKPIVVSTPQSPSAQALIAIADRVAANVSVAQHLNRDEKDVNFEASNDVVQSRGRT